MSLDHFFGLKAIWFVLFFVCLAGLINFTDLPNKMAVTSCYSADGTAACYERNEQ